MMCITYFDDVEKLINKNFLDELLLKDVLSADEEAEKEYLEMFFEELKAKEQAVVDLYKANTASKGLLTTPLVAKSEKKKELEHHLTNNFYIKLRKNRNQIKHSFIINKFLIGDILEFNYFFRNAALTFSGICIAIKKKSFVMADLALILRNVIGPTGIELVLSYFYNRAYNMLFLDYKRKFYTFNKNKLYYIRDRLNRESRVD